MVWVGLITLQQAPHPTSFRNFAICGSSTPSLLKYSLSPLPSVYVHLQLLNRSCPQVNNRCYHWNHFRLNSHSKDFGHYFMNYPLLRSNFLQNRHFVEFDQFSYSSIYFRRFCYSHSCHQNIQICLNCFNESPLFLALKFNLFQRPYQYQ